MKTYTVRAVRWEGGWELHVEELGVTQVRTLDRAEEQARDFISTVLDTAPTTGFEVDVVPDLGGVENEVRQLREEQHAAAEAQRAAATRSRALARKLRDMDLSVTDTSAVLGVTRGRVSQLLQDEASRSAKRAGDVIHRPGP